jgi:hypothetical protein
VVVKGAEGQRIALAAFTPYNVTVKAQTIIRPAGGIKIVEAETQGTIVDIPVKVLTKTGEISIIINKPVISKLIVRIVESRSDNFSKATNRSKKLPNSVCDSFPIRAKLLCDRCKLSLSVCRITKVVANHRF